MFKIINYPFISQEAVISAAKELRETAGSDGRPTEGIYVRRNTSRLAMRSNQTKRTAPAGLVLNETGVCVTCNPFA